MKIDIGLALLLGLEVLVAADIIKTVAIEPTFDSLSALGLLVVIRTFLSWALVLEIEGRWPWQSGEDGLPTAQRQLVLGAYALPLELPQSSGGSLSASIGDTVAVGELTDWLKRVIKR